MGRFVSRYLLKCLDTNRVLGCLAIVLFAMLLLIGLGLVVGGATNLLPDALFGLALLGVLPFLPLVIVAYRGMMTVNEHLWIVFGVYALRGIQGRPCEEAWRRQASRP